MVAELLNLIVAVAPSICVLLSIKAVAVTIEWI